VRRWLGNYHRLKEALEDICELNHAMLRPDGAAPRRAREEPMIQTRRAQRTFGDLRCKSCSSADSAANPSSAIGGVLAVAAARWRWCERNRSEVGSTPSRDNRRRPPGAWAANKSPVRWIRGNQAARSLRLISSTDCQMLHEPKFLFAIGLITQRCRRNHRNSRRVTTLHKHVRV
jgi:hypothetical protein